ncbi:carboxypeptidase-like regulatory domain-containing protein [Flavobacterium dauae]|uniref:carboxypeptidase-like regulatory domain-containing protein n=1 Tax=Flavobacterium dauae TaxID=1563479 RepID=UPI00101B4CE7|nr:carboxypeptidase-like regulatory domain-containing protein [Flavobacterium dauae]WLD24142.1 carboxypeptidase-like regulatory domain-containing protein [Flavobacterium dauae]
MKNSILFFFVTVSSFVQAQVTLQLSNQESKENIEFATILLPDYKKSFVTDEKGKFVIDTEQYKLPLKVIVEQFGFEQKEITLQNTTNIYNISLTPSSEILREIIIPPANAKIKERIYGRTNEGSGNIKGSFRSYNENNKDSGLKFGMILNTNNKLKKIKEIHWYLTGIDFKKAIYGIEFFEVENGKPTKRIPHADIHFIVTNKSKGWIIVNVNDLDIYIDGHKKVAAIFKTLKVEINKDQKNYLLTNVGFATANTFVFKDSEFDDWQKIPMNFPFYITVDSYE